MRWRDSTFLRFKLKLFSRIDCRCKRSLPNFVWKSSSKHDRKTYGRENENSCFNRQGESQRGQKPKKRVIKTKACLYFDITRALTCCILRPRASLVTRLASVSSLLPSLITTESSEGLRGSGEVFVTSSRGGTLDRATT